MRLGCLYGSLLLACAALAAGCGGNADQKNAYVDEVQAAQRSYVTAVDRVLDGLKPASTPAQDRETLSRFGEDTGRFATMLARVEPPADVAKEHRALTTTVVGLRRSLEQAAGRLPGDGVAARAELRQELSRSVADTQGELTRALSDINAALQD